MTTPTAAYCDKRTTVMNIKSVRAPVDHRHVCKHRGVVELIDTIGVTYDTIVSLVTGDTTAILKLIPVAWSAGVTLEGNTLHSV